MTQEEQIVRDKMQALARSVKAQLPFKDWGFILLVFPFGPGGQLLYVANAHRDDVVQAMKEFIAKNKPASEQEVFSDRSEVDADHAFEAWWKKELARVQGQGALGTGLGTIRQLCFDAYVAGMVWSVA